MQTQRIRFNGLEHQVYFWGNAKAPPVLFLHGWMDTGAGFSFVAELLKDQFYCIAPDVRGFGHSEHTSNPAGYFFHEFVLDVHRMIEFFSPGKPMCTVGHSMGGNLLSLYAGAYPERVAAFVNLEGVGPQGLSNDIAPKRLRDWLTDVDGASEGFRIYPRSEDIVARLCKANPRVPREHLDKIAPHLSRRVSGGFSFSADPKHKWTHSYVTPLAQYEAFWSAIKARCMVLLAEKTDLDKWVQHAQGGYEAEIARRLGYYPAGTRVEKVPDCGHMLHLEKPQVVADLLRAFLAAL